MKKIVFDTETTGFDPQKDKLIEIGAIELDENLQPTGAVFHQYVNPQCKIPQEATEVHGITDDFVQDKPLFDEIKQNFLTFIEGKELVAHNISFDLGFINHELGFELSNEKTDTLTLARQLFPGERCNLDALCDKLEVINQRKDYHGALLDASILAQVYVKLIEKSK